MQEIWKSLKGVVEYGDYYEVSNFGNVRSLDKIVRNVLMASGELEIKGRVLKPTIDRDGYADVDLYDKQQSKKYRVHRLVALAFIENSENKPEVNHKDGVKNNNCLDNLEWATDKEQQAHSIAMGLRAGVKGEDNHYAKLDDSRVIEIFEKYKTNNYSMQDLADEYEVSVPNIYCIISGESWQHLGLGIHKRDMSVKSKITDELTTRVKELKNQGLSERKIEKEVGVSRTTIRKILAS